MTPSNPSPDTGAGTPLTDLPTRIVVGANGAYWRDYGDHYSMCPVSADNDPIEIAAVYVRSRITEAEQWLDAARSRPATDPSHFDGRPDTPEEQRQFAEALGDHGLRPDTGAGTPRDDELLATIGSMSGFAAAREQDERFNRDAPDNINAIVAAAIRGWIARLATLDAARPATDPAGLREAMKALRGVKERLTWMGGHEHVPIDYERAMQAVEKVEADYARPSVADGPGPEDEWFGQSLGVPDPRLERRSR